MFTGIIEEIGAVKSVENRGPSGRITVTAPECSTGLKPGDSIAVNGACLTATEIKVPVFTADLSAETMKTTALKGLAAGSRVNLERALTLSTPVGGHLVTGHIDAVGTLRSMARNGEFMDIAVDVPGRLLGQMVVKGSVAVDGVSLTIAGLTPTGFTVAVIPHTLKLTTLGDNPVGASLNIETDILAKYVERSLKAQASGGLTEGFLAEHGFLNKGD